MNNNFQKWYSIEGKLQFGKLKMKTFLSSTRELNPQPSELLWDAPTIELYTGCLKKTAIHYEPYTTDEFEILHIIYFIS